jgi:hypothetical protein
MAKLCEEIPRILRQSAIVAGVRSMSNFPSEVDKKRPEKVSYDGKYPTKKPKITEINRDFFIEDFQKPSKIIKNHYELIKIRKIQEKYSGTDRENSSQHSLKQKAVLRRPDGKLEDRRKLKDENVYPYTAISFMKILYQVRREEAKNDYLRYTGTCFLIDENLFLTAGHNLHIDDDILEEAGADHKKFDIDRLNFHVYLNYKSLKGKEFFSRFFEIAGKDSYKDNSRDFGVLMIPKSVDTSEILETNGAFGLWQYPRENLELLKKYKVEVAGYPGDKNPTALYSSKGKVMSLGLDGQILYNNTTFHGNSGSPVIDLEKFEEGKSCYSLGVHTSYSPEHRLNAGVGYDGYMAKAIEEAIEKLSKL